MMRNLIISIKEMKFIKQLHMSNSGDFAHYTTKNEHLNYSITQDQYLKMN